MRRTAREADRLKMTALILCAGLTLPCCTARSGGAAKPDSAQPAAADAAAKPANPLAGTRWQLVEIQSMDDATGTRRPVKSTRYTMRLNADGTVFMRLNCNSAHGTWKAQAGQDPSSGQFEFGPLGATRMLCPPPSLDEPIAAQSRHVRSYLLKDGRLSLSLMADGGIQIWEPATEAEVESQPNRKLEEAIQRVSPSYNKAVVDQEGGFAKARYAYTLADLNGDGRDEVFAYLLGPFFCGTGGCSLLVFTPGSDGSYVLVDDFPITRLPVVISAARTNGWNDLWRLEAGGGAGPTYVRHRFDGKTYAEHERVTADRVPDGLKVLAGEVTFDNGIPLEPRQ